MISDQTRRNKSREVSSRYLSPIVAPPSPTHNHRQNVNPKPSSSSTKHKHKHTGFIRGLWPSSSQNENPPTTLADHLGSERRKDGVKRSGNSSFLSKQKSCTEFRCSEDNSNTKSSLKEYHYHTPIHGGGSMKNAGKQMMFSGRSSISSSTSSSTTKSSEFFDSNQVILPGRLSVDENALRRRSSYYEMRSDSLSDNSESSDLGSPFINSPASYMAPTMSSRKSGIEVPSKYMNPSTPMHNYNSPKKSTLKTTMKRTKSLSSSSEWESCSPSRFGSPSAAINPSFSSSKPPSPSRGKKNLLHLGLDLIKGKKGGSKLGSDDGKYMIESVHQLRLMQNSWMQWRYANARAQAVHENLAAECEKDLLCTRESMTRLRQSVVQKRLQLQKEKLNMKLNLILRSQTKTLEAWEEDIERRHIVDVSVMKDYLHNVVCMIPLIEGAKVDLESTSIAFQHTSRMVTTIKSVLSSISPTAHETMLPLSELAEVVSQEKLLLEECFEHLRVISTLEIQERNLRCSIIAMDSLIE